MITIAIGVSGICGCILLSYLIEVAGRRTLLLWTSGIIFAFGLVWLDYYGKPYTLWLISDILMWLLLVVYETVVKSIALSIVFAGIEILFIFVFCAGYGPVAQFVGVEMVPLEVGL